MKTIKDKKKKPNPPKCPYKTDCIIKIWIDGKEKIHQCETCSKIIEIE